MLNESHKHISKCKKTDKPWGYEILWAQTKDYVSKIMCIQPHQRMSLQYHDKKEETIYVMSGTVMLIEVSKNYLDDVVRLKDDYKR
jgi:mannose-6-phosphate isomerase-like protein (cupin superfamily)